MDHFGSKNFGPFHSLCLLPVKKGTLRLFKKYNLSLEILSQKAWGEIWGFFAVGSKNYRDHQLPAGNCTEAKYGLSLMQSFPSASLTSQTWYMNEFTYVWLICLCIYTCICIIKSGIVQCLLWWQRNPRRNRAFSLQPQYVHVLFTHMAFSSVSANSLLPHYPSFSI